MEDSLYAGWLPENLYYLFHLLGWMLPVVALQWLVGPRILRANLPAILPSVLIVGTYLTATDFVAVAAGVWHFDDDLILGIKVLGVPVEEVVFFYLTALLVAQCFVLFLPERFRHPARSGDGAGARPEG